MVKNPFLNKDIFKNKFKYYLLKIAPKGFIVSIELKNNIKYKLRGRVADKTVLKEVWLKNMYNQFGVKVEDGDLVIDIGAHVGIFSTYAAENNKSGKIFSFEPFQDNFNRLKFHRDLNKKSNIKTLNYGIAGENGKKFFYVNSKNSGGNSFIKNVERKKEVKIEAIKLSDFCKKEKIQKIDFLKIDCEGAEFEKFQNDLDHNPNSSDKVRVTDLIFRLNEEKKIEKKRNLALGVAAVSAVTVFGIILTI